MVGPRRRNSPVLRGVNKRGPVAARVLHVLTTQRASPTRRAVTNDALQESRREPPENSVSLTGGPRAPPGSECDSPPEPCRPLRHLSRVGPLVLPSASADQRVTSASSAFASSCVPVAHPQAAVSCSSESPTLRGEITVEGCSPAEFTTVSGTGFA